MDEQIILQGARDNMGPCKACPVCNSAACKTTSPARELKARGMWPYAITRNGKRSA